MARKPISILALSFCAVTLFFDSSMAVAKDSKIAATGGGSFASGESKAPKKITFQLFKDQETQQIEGTLKVRSSDLAVPVDAEMDCMVLEDQLDEEGNVIATTLTTSGLVVSPEEGEVTELERTALLVVEVTTEAILVSEVQIIATEQHDPEACQSVAMPTAEIPLDGEVIIHR